MAAKKVKRSVAAKKGAPPEAGGARVFPLAALRAALGTEVDRVRRYGGYTLILRRGRAVAAVIPYEEFERLTMQDRNGKGTKAGGAPRQMTPTELIAEVVVPTANDILDAPQQRLHNIASLHVDRDVGRELRSLLQQQFANATTQIRRHFAPEHVCVRA